MDLRSGDVSDEWRRPPHYSPLVGVFFKSNTVARRPLPKKPSRGNVVVVCQREYVARGWLLTTRSQVQVLQPEPIEGPTIQVGLFLTQKFNTKVLELRL